MDNGPPTALFLAASSVFGVAAFLGIFYAERMKRWRDANALFEFQRRFPASAYRASGWMFAVCSVFFFVVAIGKLLGF
jgi:hypothetical protein